MTRIQTPAVRSDLASREARAVASTHKEIFWRADARGEWTEAIPSWKDFTGAGAEDARGDRWLELLHPDDRERTAALWARCVASREPYRNEYRLRRPDGGWRYMAVRGVPRLALDGSVREWIGFSEDITESRLARQSLAHERAMLEHLACGGSLTQVLTELVVGHEQLHPGTLGSVLLCDAEGTHLLHGAAPSLPASYCKAIHGAPIGPNVGSCGTAAYTGETVIVADIETDFRWADYRGFALPFGLRACWSTPIRSRHGKMLGTFALYYREPRTPHPEELAAVETGARLAAVAIERKLEEDAVLEWKNRYEAVIQASGHLLYDWDPASNKVTYGGDCQRILGYSVEELGSDLSHWIGRIHPEDRAAFQHEIERVLRTGEPFHCAYRMRRKDGAQVDVQDDGYFVLDSDRVVTRMVGFVVDVTQRKRSEEQARQTQKMNAIGELAGGVAHDFNNQLAAILGFSDLLSSQLQEPALLRLADGIGVAARRSADLTQKLLAFARKGHYRAVPVDLRAVIAETLAILEHSIDKRIALVQKIHAPETVILGDPTQVQSALLNMALNSRDAMPDGGTLTFEVAVAGDASRACESCHHEVLPGAHLRVTVGDTGTGIDEEVRKHLFEPFFTTKPVGKGAGMGLASVYGTVKSHGGSIRVESETGVGTRISICLPFEATARSSAEAIPEAPKDEANGAVVRHAARKNLRILVVDDEENLLAMIPRMLEPGGHEAIVVADGAAAVEVYSKRWQEIDLVMLDMMMPGMTGRETFLALKAINPAAKILLSSGYSLDGAAREVMKDGAKGFIQKPFLISELETAVAQAVAQAAAQATDR